MTNLTRWQRFKAYVYQVSLAVNRLANALHCGSSSETICCRAWLNRHRYPYKIYVLALDAAFYPWQGPGHCKGALRKEIDRAHVSREMLMALADKN